MLLRKAARAIWRNKRSYLACIFLIALGIMMYTAMGTAARGLETATLTFYRDYRLPDVFAGVEAMPEGFTQVLEDIPGVKRAQARSVGQFRAEVPGARETITLRLISALAPEEEPLNDLHLTGSFPQGRDQVALNPAFLEYHGLELGDTLSVFAGGREYLLTISAVALSPETVYIVPDAAQMLPDEGGFGVGYVTAECLTALTGEVGTANQVVFQLEAGVEFKAVKPLLEDSLAPFGLRELYDRDGQLSYAYLKMELDSVGAMSNSMPLLFLMLAMVILYLMMKRVIEQDRTQIGMLKAFGFSGRQVLLHYLLYGGFTGLLGGLAGWILGALMSGVYLELFLQFFRLPPQQSGFDLTSIFSALALALGSGLLGSAMGAGKVMGLEPAEAMRPESPKPVRFDPLARLGILRALLTSRGAMALRGIARSPLRSTFLAFSMMVSFAMLVVVGSFNGIIDKMIFSQFTEILRHQVRLTLEEPVDYDGAVSAALALPGVTQAEGLLELPAELVRGHLREGAMMTGIPTDSRLYRVADTDTRAVYAPPGNGVILAGILADRLGVAAGETVLVSSPLLTEDIPLRVTAVVEQSLGTGCYMELDALADLFRQPASATAVMLNTGDLEGLREQLKNSDRVASIDDQASTLQKYRDMMGMYDGMYLVMGLMGVMVAFAVIYNTSTISLSERKREYATLRVLGLSVKEVSEIMRFEFSVLSGLGMVLGIPCAGLLNSAMNGLVEDTGFRMPAVLPTEAYLLGAVGCVAAIWLAGFSSRRKIAAFDMVEVLKERE